MARRRSSDEVQRFDLAKYMVLIGLIIVFIIFFIIMGRYFIFWGVAGPESFEKKKGSKNTSTLIQPQFVRSIAIYLKG